MWGRAPKAAPLVVTAGEPAGIGPDLCIQLALAPPAEIPLVILANRALIEARVQRLGRTLVLPDYVPGGAARLSLLSLPMAAPVEPGRPDPANAAYVLACLRRAVEGCLAGEFAGLVTGPVHKGVINEAGLPFTGHTEYLAALTDTPRVVMMLTGAGLRVALATTHLPLKDVPAAIDRASLTDTLRILHRALGADFGLEQPHILVAGLNPHAGEGGHLGREEIEVIEPVLETLRREGMRLTGPLPADTLFRRERLETADAVLAMYHDQGLPVLKFASFGSGVNVTLGLPIVRTSVDHGTALELAGTGQVREGSLRMAIDLAWEMAQRRAYKAHAGLT